MAIHESAENYLETILILSERNAVVRSVDIAAELDFTKPSVSVAMKNLRDGGYITMDKDSHIFLTEAGKEIADEMYARHKFLSEWLISLGVDRDTALRDACRIEHVISPDSFEAMKKNFS